MTRLRFRADGRFRIVQFTDMHFCDGLAPDRRTRALMERVLQAERPDLVVLTGDVIDGGRAPDPAAAWRAAVSAVVERGLPWAAVFGNHDDEGRLGRAELMRVQRASRGCLSRRGPVRIGGVGNYVIEVAGRRRDRPAALLYCFDSGGYAPAGPGHYAWVTHAQVAWYLRTSERLARRCGRRLPALAFLHIPLPEFRAAWDAGARRGSRLEPVCSPEINSGLFAAFHERGDVIAVFAGHDHLNDFDAALFGIRLCYGRATGYNTYGRRGFERGARVIELREGRRGIRTWRRLASGAVLR